MTRDRRDVVAKADKQRTFKRAGNATLLVNIVASWLTVDSGSVLDRWVAARGVSTVPSSTKVRYILRGCGVSMHSYGIESSIPYKAWR